MIKLLTESQQYKNSLELKVSLTAKQSSWCITNLPRISGITCCRIYA